MTWIPPGKDCGQCGEKSCDELLKKIEIHQKNKNVCPYCGDQDTSNVDDISQTNYTKLDVLGKKYDFILRAFPGEISARKIVLPFRPDLVEKWKIRSGDLVLGRPMGAGCPVQHAIKVITAEYNTGLITGHVVGPKEIRDGKKYHDLGAYHMIGFEGVATEIKCEPCFGNRVMFLPGFCMMNAAHTGLINFVSKVGDRMDVRIEDIIIMNHV